VLPANLFYMFDYALYEADAPEGPGLGVEVIEKTEAAGRWKSSG
jgi:hypothetical protein